MDTVQNSRALPLATENHSTPLAETPKVHPQKYKKQGLAAEARAPSDKYPAKTVQEAMHGMPTHTHTRD